MRGTIWLPLVQYPPAVEHSLKVARAALFNSTRTRTMVGFQVDEQNKK